MENKKYYYMKLKEGFFESESMILLESVKDGFLYSNILMKMYLKSLKSNGRLMLNEYIPYNPSMIASVTRQPVGVVNEALKYFKQLGLIEILDNGTIYMNDIELFIGQSSSEGERKKIARMKLKEQGLLSGQNLDKCPTKLSLNSNSLNSISLESNINNNLNDSSLDININNDDKNNKKKNKEKSIKELLDIAIENLKIDEINDSEYLLAIEEFIKMRKRIKKELTEYAMKLICNKLNKLSNDKETQIKILEQSIVKGWQDIYELKEDNNYNNNNNNVKTKPSYELPTFN